MNIFKKKQKLKNNLVLVDVDGTISPCSYPTGNNDPFYSHSWHGSHHFPNALKKDILKLPDSDFYWLTFWQEDAEDTFKMNWKTITFENDNISPFETRKFNALKNFLDKNNHSYQKIIWFDDEISYWSDRLPELNIPVFAPKIKLFRGLSPKILAEAKDFLEN